MRMQNRFQRIAVYCASSSVVDDLYFDAARAMGRLLAEQGIGIVYGGGRVGLMGAVADAAIEAGGEVIGVIPTRLDDLELGHRGITELIVVEGMAPRKLKMIELADAFIALPGGFGTWEEIFEVATLGMLSYHRKPMGLLNVNHYYDHLLRFMTQAADEGFVRPACRGLLQVATDPSELLKKLAVQTLPSLEDVYKS